MNIVLVHPIFNWASGDISRAFEKALIKMGYNVKIFDTYSKLSQVRKKFKFIKDIYINPHFIDEFCFKEFLDDIKNKKVDLVIFIHGNMVPKKVLRFLNENKINTAVWFLDDPHEIDLSSKYSKYFSFIFTDEKNAVSVHLRNNKNVFYLPVGYDEDIYFPAEEKDERYISDICVAANGFKERIELLEKIYPKISKYNIKIVGNWSFLSLSSPLRKHVMTNDIIAPKELARYYRGAKIVLNPHRDPYGLSLGSNLFNVEAISPNPRVFEATACASFMITDDYRKDVFSYFEKGVEIDSFSNTEELTYKINYWLSNDYKRKEGAKKAAKKALSHTIYLRAQELLKKCINVVYAY